MVRKSAGMTIPDALITLCAIGVLFGVVVWKYQRLALEAQKTALRAELVNIRSSIDLFRMANGRNPETLNEMMERNVVLPARVGPNAYTGSMFRHKYLMPHAVDEKGNALDAFGNRFKYDSREGVVRASTAGYEDW
jgi:Tfp pilus assembly protein PilE